MSFKLLNEEEYSKSTAINYSTLSAMSKDPTNLLVTPEERDRMYKTSYPMRLGSLVDCTIFTPEQVKDRFYFASATEPGDKMGEILTNYLASGGTPIESEEDLNEDNLLLLRNARTAIGFQPSWGEPAFLTNFFKSCGPFMHDYIAAGNRAIVPPKMKEESDKVITGLLTSDIPFISTILSGPGQKSLDKFGQIRAGLWKVAYQTGMEFEYRFGGKTLPRVGFAKVKLDTIAVRNHEALVVDLKVTSKNPRDFYYEWIKSGYYIQAAMYHDGAARMLQFTGAVNNVSLANVTFMFIVASPLYPAQVWTVSPEMIKAGTTGANLPGGGRIRGYEELIDQYLWHIETSMYTYTEDEMGLKNILRINLA